MNQKNILLIYPSSENTTLKNNRLLALLWKKDYATPKELIEISIQLPLTWEKRILDQNLERIKEEEIEWADFVIIRANANQLDATQKIINQCNKQNKTIAVSGSLFESNTELIAQVDYFISNSEDFYKFSEEFEENKANKIYKPRQKLISSHKWHPYYSMRNFSGRFLRNIQLFPS